MKLKFAIFSDKDYRKLEEAMNVWVEKFKIENVSSTSISSAPRVDGRGIIHTVIVLYND